MKSAWMLILFLFCRAVLAHQNSVAFLTLAEDTDNILARIDVAVRDLDFVANLDENSDSEVTWGEIKKRIPQIQEYVFSRVHLSSNGKPIQWVPGEVLVEERTLGSYLVLTSRLPKTSRLEVDYDLFFELDRGHRCFVNVEAEGTPIVLSSAQKRALFDFGTTPPRQTLSRFIKEGVTHIFAGIDHICFLIALLLPAVWQRTEHGWVPAGNLRTVLISVLKIVTAFTIAHSLTLSLAALGLVRLPSALVESVIALSVFLAALNNIVPIWRDHSWPVAFGFGLLHGFGFASVLGEITTTSSSLVSALFGFNIGVELGQLCIVLAAVPLAFLLRKTAGYRIVAVRLGSTAIACVAMMWLVERVFAVRIF